MGKLKYLNGAIFTLKLAVLYPIDETNTKLRKIVYFIWGFLFISSFVTVIIQCSVYLYINPFDLIEEIMTLMNWVFYSSLFINFIIFYWKSKDLSEFVTNIRLNFSDKTDNLIEEISMEQASKFADKMAYYWTTSLAVISIVPSTLSLMAGNKTMPIPVWFPYDLEKSPLFEISYFWQIFCLLNLGIIYGATDMIYPCITVIVGQQFKILANNFRNNVFYALVKSGVPPEHVQEFSQKFNNNCGDLNVLMLHQQFEDIALTMQSENFKKINSNYLKKNVKHHKKILGLCEDISGILSTFLLVKIIAVMFNLIFIAFGFINIEDEALMLGLSNYFFFATLEILIYTYGGQILKQSGDFLWVLYESPWYLSDLEFQKMFLMVQMRTNKVFSTKAGNYFELSAPAFIGFMKAVFSYIAVLKEVTERKEI